MRSKRSLLAVVLLVLIVSGGVLLGLSRSSLQAGSLAARPSTQDIGSGSALAGLGTAVYGPAASAPTTAGPSIPIAAGGTTVSTMATSTQAALSTGGTTVINGNGPSHGSGAPLSSTSTGANASRDIEFFSNVTLQADSVSTVYAQAVAIAYSSGGYVADSTESNTTALVVMRVPAAGFQGALTEVQGLGTLVSISSSSNDVTVQYTDLNATLASLHAEQTSLLAILGQSTNINSTLNVESRIQGVDQQINSVQSEILQTKTLVSYATISAFVEEKAKASPLTMKVTATPRTGDSPLSVTFNAVTKGGVQPYIVNYNFGDGSSYEGQSLIHTFVQPGRYNVTVTATDASANVTEGWALVDVSAPPAASGFGGFPSFVGGLFLQVVEGIVEVAVVILPIAGVLLLVFFPLRHRLGLSSSPRQGAGEDREEAQGG